MVTLLLLSANPLDSEKLRLDEEFRDIQDCVAAGPRKRICIEMRLAVRLQDLRKLLLEFRPAIVHFSDACLRYPEQDGAWHP
jgi:hypothetical protein